MSNGILTYQMDLDTTPRVIQGEDGELTTYRGRVVYRGQVVGKAAAETQRELVTGLCYALAQHMRRMAQQ